ncbi:MFS transporter [Fodinicola feengrottensis]|uniref:MFS transporter n=1 Tax=Fodinicola feengrottensis TaxID=435914 RepID=UPI0013D0B88E|nr:MFS transporter [Fodinicola feengrottensis]
MCAAIVLVPVTATGASIALPDISASLHTSLASAQWVVNAFFLTFASFMAISGSLADLAGRRLMFATGIAVFCAAMLVAAYAPVIGVLILARVIAGIGAAAVVTGGSALLAHAYAGRGRSRAFALFGTAIGLGLAFGPLIAGVLVTALGSWRAFFLVAAVILVPVLLVTPLLPASRERHRAGLDLPGAITLTLSLSAFVFGVIEGPSLGWRHPLVICALVAAAALMAAFVIVERRGTHPMIDVSLFAEPRFLAICVIPILLAFGFVAPLLALPAYFMGGGRHRCANGRPAAGAADRSDAGRTGGGRRHRAPGLSQRVLLVATMVLTAVGAAWSTLTIHAGAYAGELAGPLLLIGTGFGVSLAVLDGAAVSAVSPARAGMAAGVFNTMRLGGEAVAIAVLGSLLAGVTQARLTGSLGADRASAVTARLLQGDMSGTLAAGGEPAAQLRVIASNAYTDALHTGMWTIAATAALGAAIVAVLVRKRPVSTGNDGEVKEMALAGTAAG